MRPPRSRLARLEERLRIRVHQGENRMEDADPVDMTIARLGIRMLDLVDRATGFRARDESRHE